jgi:hypothetical protein
VHQLEEPGQIDLSKWSQIADHREGLLEEAEVKNRRRMRARSKRVKPLNSKMRMWSPRTIQNWLHQEIQGEDVDLVAKGRSVMT